MKPEPLQLSLKLALAFPCRKLSFSLSLLVRCGSQSWEYLPMKELLNWSEHNQIVFYVRTSFTPHGSMGVLCQGSGNILCWKRRVDWLALIDCLVHGAKVRSCSTCNRIFLEATWSPVSHFRLLWGDSEPCLCHLHPFHGGAQTNSANLKVSAIPCPYRIILKLCLPLHSSLFRTLKSCYGLVCTQAQRGYHYVTVATTVSIYCYFIVAAISSTIIATTIPTIIIFISY